MPTKRGEYHTDIRPRYGHPGDVRFDVSKKRVGEYRNVVQVPWVLGIWVHRVCLQSGHSTTRCKKKNPLSTFFHPAQRNEGSLPSVCGRMHISTILNFHRF